MSPAFVRAVPSRYAVFAVGYRTRYHFPRPRVVARHRAAGARLLDSVYAGAVNFDVTWRQGVVLAARYRLRHARPWTDP